MTSSHRPLRVLYVINGLGTGGAERSLSELIAPLRDRRVDVEVVSLERRSQGVQSQVVAATHVHFVGPGWLRSGAGVRRAIRRSRPDVVHTTLFDADVLGRLASIGLRTPVVTSVVNTSYERLDEPHPDVPEIKLRVVRLVDGLTARHLVSRFHTLTAASATAASDALGVSLDAINVIPRGRDPVRLGRRTAERRTRAREALAVTDEQPVLLSVGRQEHQKGQMHAIEAMPHIIRAHPGALLLIAGRQGAASERLQAAVAAEGVEGNVRFLGHHDDVPELMTAADVLVFPSLYEGFGGTLIEAMALELPIVASDIPTLREVTSDTAVLTAVGSTSELADAVTRLLADPARASHMTAAARARFEAHYTIDAVADRMADFYRRVADAGK